MQLYHFSPGSVKFKIWFPLFPAEQQRGRVSIIYINDTLPHLDSSLIFWRSVPSFLKFNNKLNYNKCFIYFLVLFIVYVIILLLYFIFVNIFL